MQAPEELFKDFFLFGLDHFMPDDVQEPMSTRLRPDALEMVRKRIEQAKEVIRRNTTKGDVVAFESPERFRFRQFIREAEADSWQPLTEEAKRRKRKHWDAFEREYMNFYHTLAEYAKSIGRTVISLESGIRNRDSKFNIAYENEPFGTKKRRMYFLLGARATHSFISKIRWLKPKMVVTATGHAAYIEGLIAPARTAYIPEISRKKRQKIFEETKVLEARYKRKKMERLRKARARAKRMRRKI